MFLPLIAAISAAVVVAPTPVSADQVGALRQQATRLSAQLLQEQLAVGGYEQQVAAANARLAQDAAAISATEQAIAHDSARVDAARRVLAGQVVTAYVHTDVVGSGVVGALFATNQRTLADRNEYQQVADGDLSVSMDQLRTAESVLQARQSVLRQHQAEDQSTRATAAHLVAQATQTQQAIQQQSATITGQLAAAIKSEQSAQAATAAAAVKAAQRVAASRSAGSTSGASTPTAPSTTAATATPTAASGASQATSDPALNPFLQCVVQRESHGDYSVVSANGLYMGAFQFSQSTWNEAARLAGLPGLVGTPPNLASKADQDTIAVALYALDGQQPWYGNCP